MSTLKVVAAAIAHMHVDVDLANPCGGDVGQAIRADVFSQESSSRGTLPLDIDCNRAIRNTVHEPRVTKRGITS